MFQGIYDIHTRLQGIPILPWEPPPLAVNIYASEIMSYPVIAFRGVEKVSKIIEILKTKCHNGFPVVDIDEVSISFFFYLKTFMVIILIFSKCFICIQEDNDARLKSYGRYRGLILRSQLIVLLYNRIFNETLDKWDMRKPDLKMFRNAYPRYKGLETLKLSEEEMNYHIDLRPFMNPSSYTVFHVS